MKKTLSLVAALAVFIVGCATAPRDASWEYRVLRGTAPNLENDLNAAAKMGYVLVSSTTVENVTTVIMRRPMENRAALRHGSAFGQEAEFQKQLATSLPVREYGYTIMDLRFSESYEKALVTFVHADPTRRPWEFILQDDGFRRYRGSSIQPFYTPGTANTPSVAITVLLPDK